MTICLSDFTNLKSQKFKVTYITTTSSVLLPSRYMKITVIAGGGAGGGWESGAGGAGGAAIKWFDNIIPGSVVTAIIGAGGGNPGGTSSITIPTTNFGNFELYATGGRTPGRPAGGIGGQGFNGDINVFGGGGESYGSLIYIGSGGSSLLSGGNSYDPGLPAGAGSNYSRPLRPPGGGGGKAAASGNPGLIILEW